VSDDDSDSSEHFTATNGPPEKLESSGLGDLGVGARSPYVANLLLELRVQLHLIATDPGEYAWGDRTVDTNRLSDARFFRERNSDSGTRTRPG
jgi:hypothetical protein